MKEVEIEEISRVYHYPGGDKLFFPNVYNLRVSESGYHYLDFADRRKAIVSPGWLWIEIEAHDWSA